MERRDFLRHAAPVVGGAAAIALSAASETEPWRLRWKLPPAGRPLYDSTLYDALTGEDVSNQFPVRTAQRLYRSLMTGRPCVVAIYELRDGKVFSAGDRICMKPVRVQVIAA